MGFADFGESLFFSVLCMVCGIMFTYFEIKEVDVMSVILGYQIKDRIVISADNRTSDIKGKLKSDTEKKIVVFNNHLCVATAGNRLGYLMLEAIYKQNNMNDFYTEDFAGKLAELYRKNENNIFYKLPVSYIMGGKSRNGGCIMLAIDATNGKLNPIPCIKIIYPPDGIKPEITNKILDKNISKHPQDFYIHTIHKVSRKSKLVSHSGDVWIYDLNTDKSTLEHFS